MSDVDWADITHRVAIHLFGDPNPQVSSPRRGEYRWGEHGRFSLLVDPNPKAGVWYDYSAGEGGGIVKLLEFGLNLDHDGAIKWLRSNGYLDGQPPDVQPPVRDPEEMRQNAARRRQEAQNAALRAQAMVQNAKLDYHPYLASKGFHGFRGLVAPSGLLLVPMWSMSGKEIRAVQTIDADGGKRFVPRGCAVANTAHFIGGRQGLWWWCEGYITGLSIWESLKQLYRTNDRVVVAFSAGAIAKYAKHGVVVAEHDWYICQSETCKNRWDAPWGDTACPKCGSDRILPPAGERAARITGLPFFVPPRIGEDANDHRSKDSVNDFYVREGSDVLSQYLWELARQA